MLILVLFVNKITIFYLSRRIKKLKYKLYCALCASLYAYTFYCIPSTKLNLFHSINEENNDSAASLTVLALYTINKSVLQ